MGRGLVGADGGRPVGPTVCIVGKISLKPSLGDYYQSFCHRFHPLSVRPVSVEEVGRLRLGGRSRGVAGWWSPVSGRLVARYVQ